jgi:hypothetical protein
MSVSVTDEKQSLPIPLAAEAITCLKRHLEEIGGCTWLNQTSRLMKLVMPNATKQQVELCSRSYLNNG